MALEGVDVSFSSFLCAREKNRLGSGEKVEALLAKRVGRSKNIIINIPKVMNA